MKVIKIIFVGILCLGISTLALATEFPDPTITNLNNDRLTDFADFAIMAAHWGKTGTKLAGDFDDSNTVNIDDLLIFSWYWLEEYSEYQQCQRIDLDSDGIIALEDLAKFAANWLLSGEGLTGDFDDSNLVDYRDLYSMSDCWLKGSRPEAVFEQFKAALAAGDVNTALTFISETSKEKYAEIFQIIGTRLPDYAAGMGDLIFDSEEEGKVKYEMPYQVGMETYLFSVIFVKDEDRSWKIDNF